MTSYVDSWIESARALFSQALAGEAQLVDSLPKPFAGGSFGFAVTLSGDEVGRFAVILDAAVLESPLLGEGVDQKAAWGELLREVADAAAGDLLAKQGKTCHVDRIEAIVAESQISRAFLLKNSEHAWPICIRDDVQAPKTEKPKTAGPASEPNPRQEIPPLAERSGLELLSDVELEATLRFGCRELPLGEILELGPGDVIQLDRHIQDPVELIVSDKIVARGEVVLVNGNFGLRVTEVAAPHLRLESIRCIF